MTAQPLLQFRTIALDPAPDCRVIRLQAAFAEQFYDMRGTRAIIGRYERTAQKIQQTGSVCRNFDPIGGRIPSVIMASRHG